MDAWHWGKLENRPMGLGAGAKKGKGKKNPGKNKVLVSFYRGISLTVGFSKCKVNTSRVDKEGGIAEKCFLPVSRGNRG